MTQGRREAYDDEDEWAEGAEHATGGYTEDEDEDEDFDYEEYIEREFPSRKASRDPGSWKKWAWRATVVIICLLLIWQFLLF